MWTFLGDLMPGQVWAWGGVAVLAVLGPWIGYQLGRRSARASEQRQILKDLLLAISSARIKEQPDHGYSDDQSEWFRANSEVHSLINDLLCQSSRQGLRSRLRTLDIISPLHWHSGNGEVSEQLVEELQAIGTTEVRLEAMVLDDAYQVVAAAIRGEDLPTLDENEELAEIEGWFIMFAGQHPNL